MTILTQPDTSTDIIRPQTIGTVHCINTARANEPQQLRYFGTSAVCGASGQARTTQAQAAQDVADWADGKDVAYEQHAVVPKAGMFTATTCSTYPHVPKGDSTATSRIELRSRPI
jgi:hypothetical protein